MAAARRQSAGKLAPTLPLLSLAFIGGTLTAAAFGGSPVILAATVAVVLAGTRLRGPVPLLACAAAVALAAAGHARFEDAASSPPPSVVSAVGDERAIEGVVRDDAAVDGVIARLDVDVTRVDGSTADGGVRVTLPVRDGVPREGDRIRVTGDLQPPPSIEGFDYDAYLHSLGVHAVVSYPSAIEVLQPDTGSSVVRAIRDFRRAALANIGRSLPEPEAALAAGVLIGERGSLPSELADDLRVTGTTHLVVVSGQNVAVLLGVTIGLLTAVVSRRIASLLALLLLPAYVLLTGADPPVVRGALMAAGIAVAGVAGRRTPAWIYLAYAVALMLALDPLLALDLAFQLSATATAGVVLLAPVLRTLAVSALRVSETSPLTALVDAVTTTTSASLAVLPLQAAAFGYISLVAVPANAAVGLLYEGTLLVAGLSVALGWFSPAAAALGAGGSLVPAAFIATIAAFADIPRAAVPASMSAASAAAWYAVLGAGTWALARWLISGGNVATGGGTPRLARTAALGVVAAGVWFAALTPSNDLARVVVLDVGQGLAVLVEDGNAAVLVDAGPPDGTVLAAMSESRIRGDIDALILTHDDIDHTGGAAELLRRHEVGAVLSGSDAGPPSTRVDIGDRLRLSERTVVEVLSPPVVTATHAHESDNNRSLVLLVTVGQRRILLTGDIEAAAEEWLVGSGLDLRADVLVIPHHGSDTSSTPAFLDAVQPSLAIVSAGAGNPHGHPHPAVLGRYEAAGVQVLRTDERGSLEVRSDGDALWLETER